IGGLFQFTGFDSTYENYWLLNFDYPKVGTFSTRGTRPGMTIFYTYAQSTTFVAYPETEDSVTVVVTEMVPYLKATFHGKLNVGPDITSGLPPITMTGGIIANW
ncbi:MAG TPA: hypothetical protein VIX80_04625, partial [Candidatus Kapabacteria bacterium]